MRAYPVLSMETSNQLKRSLSLLDVIALGINGVIGSGIFLLPGLMAEKMGPASLLVVIFGGFLCFMIALCFAETGSYFSGTGGPYLYARDAFGSFVGFEVGWMTWCVRVISWAALSNAFAIKLLPFLPTSIQEASWINPVIVCGLIVILTIPNIFGAEFGAKLSSFFTAAKLIPLFVFIGVGVFFIDFDKLTPFAPNGFGDFGESSVILLYAYVGFEVLAVPAGEMKNPKRAVPIALVTVLLLCSAVYFLVMAVSLGTLDNIAGSKNPVEDASRVFMGPAGGTLISVGIAISIFGVNSGSALITPRCMYALAENGQLPKAFASIHPRYKTPIAAILVSSLVTLALALSGSFKQLAVISVVARFAQYIPTCIAIFVLRKKKGTANFSLPGGLSIPIAATALSLWLLSQAKTEQLLAGASAAAIGVPIYLWMHRKNKSAKDS